MNKDREAIFTSKIKEAHEQMLAGLRTLKFKADGIENKDNENETAVIARWTDYDVVEKECSCR